MESEITLEKTLKQKKRISKALKGFYCPISHEIMAMPVTIHLNIDESDEDEEHTFEEEKIKEWLDKNDTNPLTGKKLKSKKLKSNRTMRRLITEHLHNNPDDWDKVYKPQAWYEGIVTAIKSSQMKKVNDLLGKDPRLLTTPLTEGYTALHLALEFASDELINFIIHKLTEKQKLDAACLKALLQHQKHMLAREIEKSEEPRADIQASPTTLPYYEITRKKSSPQKIFKRDNSNISTMCELPNNWIAKGLVTGKILIQDENGNLIRELEGHPSPITCFRYLVQNNSLASADQTGMIFIWNLESFQRKVLFKHMKAVFHLNLLSKGPYAQCLTSCSADNSFIIWDMNAINPKDNYKVVCTEHIGPVLCLEELSDGRLISCSMDATLRLWSSKGEFIEVLKEHQDAVLCVTELVDDNDPQNIRVASGSQDGAIIIWNLDTGTRNKLTGHTGPVTSLLYMDNDKLISGSHDQTLMVWNLKTMSCTNKLEGHEAPITSLRKFDQEIRSSAEDGTVLRWDIEDFTILTNSPFQNHASPLRPRTLF